MSWLILNIILGIEIFVIYLVGINVRNMLHTIHGVHNWMLPFGDNLVDIREEMTHFLDDVRGEVLPMMTNFRYIMVTAFLAVFANMANDPIVWVPLLASVWFTLESIFDLYQINWFGEALNTNLEHAEETVMKRVYADAVEHAKHMSNNPQE